MSPIGKLLLTYCDNNLKVDLNAIPGLLRVHHGMFTIVALHLGLKIKGKS